MLSLRLLGLSCLLAYAGATIPHNSMSYESVPTRSVAGVNMPDTPLVKKAIKVADKALHGFVFNHVMRSMLYGFTIGDVLFPNRDKGTVFTHFHA